MRIKDKQSSERLGASAYTAANPELRLSNAKDFPNVLEKQYLSDSKDDLEKMLNKLEEIGKRLVESFSIYELKNYKDTMRDFLQTTQGQAYKLKEETVFFRQGKTKIMHLIEKIDAELEELSKLVLGRQKNQVELLKKMDQIRGLLVDLYS